MTSQGSARRARALPWLAALGGAWAMGLLVTPAWQPQKIAVDLSRVSAVPSIVSGGQVVPSPRWREVMDLYDRGEPLVLAVTLPTQEGYWWRFKLAGPTVGQQVALSVNGIPQPPCVLRKGRWEAERFDRVTGPEAIRAGTNHLQLDSKAPARQIRYEQVRAQNYRAELIPRAAYVIYAAWPVAPLTPWQWATWLIVAGGGVWGALLIGARMFRWSYRLPPDRVVWWLPIPFLAGFLVAAHAMAQWTPYRWLFSPAIGTGVLLGVIMLQGILLSAPGVLGRTARFVWTRVLPASLTMGIAGSRSVGRAAEGLCASGLGTTKRLGALIQALGTILCGLGALMQVFGTILRGIGIAVGRLAGRAVTCGTPWLAGVMWRAIRRRQNPEGYLQFFVGLLLVAGLLWLLGAKPAADRVSEWAWCALLVACLGYAIRALRAEQDAD